MSSGETIIEDSDSGSNQEPQIPSISIEESLSAAIDRIFALAAATLPNPITNTTLDASSGSSNNNTTRTARSVDFSYLFRGINDNNNNDRSSRPSPASREAIDAMARIIVKEGGARDDCAICLGEIGIGCEIREMATCSHGFHSVCIERWLQIHGSCPVCRSVMS